MYFVQKYYLYHSFTLPIFSFKAAAKRYPVTADAISGKNPLGKKEVSVRLWLGLLKKTSSIALSVRITSECITLLIPEVMSNSGID